MVSFIQRAIMIGIAVILFMPGAQSVGMITLTDRLQIAALTDLQKQYEAISKNVMGCMEAGGSQPDCLCRHRKMIETFNLSVARVMHDHPVLKTLEAVRFRRANGIMLMQNLRAIRQQAATAPACSP